METREKMKTSSCNKSKLGVGRTGTKVSIIDTSYELHPKRYISKVGFEGNCQKKSVKTVSGSSSNKGKLLDDMDMSEVEPSVGFYPEHVNEDEIYVPHPDVPNGDHGLPDDNSTRCEVDDTSNGPSPFQRSILDHLSSIMDDPEIEPSYKRLMECLSKDENAFTYDVPISGDHAVPSTENLNAHDLVCTTDEHGRVLYIEPSDIKACKNNRAAPLLSSGGSSMFDEKLNVILSRPYDKDECEELWRKATKRKIYVSGKVGQSYLDYHPDLAVQIESASRDDERLSLLRTFFFWLQNLCHEGAYKPWRHGCPRQLMSMSQGKR